MKSRDGWWSCSMKTKVPRNGGNRSIAKTFKTARQIMRDALDRGCIVWPVRISKRKIAIWKW